MEMSEDRRFDVYVYTRTAVVTLLRQVSDRAACVVARHHAEALGKPVCIRNRATGAVETVAPPSRASV